MNFSTKSYLKSNRYYTPKHALNHNLFFNYIKTIVTIYFLRKKNLNHDFTFLFFYKDYDSRVFEIVKDIFLFFF